MVNAPQPPTKGTWWRRPLDDCIAFVREDHELLALTQQALVRTINEPELTRALVNWDQVSAGLDPESDEQRAKVDSSIRAAAFAKREFDSGFTLLHAHSLVLVWGALETMVVDLCIASLKNVPGLLDSHEFRKIKIPFGEFLELTEDERMVALLALSDREGRGLAWQGVARLEGLLRLVGLDGEMDDPDLRADLHTMYQVRNLFVHRRGVVDKLFLANCQPVGGTLGERLRFEPALYIQLQMAATHYVFVVFNRCCRIYGGQRLEWQYS